MKATDNKSKGGRPKVLIDWQQVGRYAESGASGVGIAAVIGVDEATLRNRCPAENNCSFSEFLQQKKAKGDEHLRDKQYEVALTGNVPMLIWVGKNRLGQADKQEVTQTKDRQTIINEVRAQFIADGQPADAVDAVIQKLYPDAQLVTDAVN